MVFIGIAKTRKKTQFLKLLVWNFALVPTQPVIAASHDATKNKCFLQKKGKRAFQSQHCLTFIVSRVWPSPELHSHQI